jgi:O-antigen/teichoic acid export membrane protein
MAHGASAMNELEIPELTMTAMVQTHRAAPPASVRARFAVGAFWSLVGAAVARGLTLAAFVVAGRLLGTAGFGEVGMVQSTQGLFGVLAGTGLGLAATKYVAEYRAIDEARAGRCLAVALRIAVVAGGASAVVLGILAGPIAEGVLHAPHLAAELRVATGLILFGAIGGVQTGALAGLGDFRAVALLSILRGACLFGLLLAGIALAGVMGAVIGLVLAEGVAAGANQVVLRRLFPQSECRTASSEPVVRELAAMIRFSGLAVLGSLALMLALWFGNVVMVNQPDGYAALGVFNAAERWRQLLLFLPASVSPIILSMLSHLHGRNDTASYRQLLGINLWVGVGTVAVPAIGVMLAAPLAMSIFGAEYQGGAITLVLLAASAVAGAANTLLGQVLISRGAIGGRVALDLVLAGVLALVAWQAVPLYRDRGLALANLAAYAVTAVALIPLVVRCLKRAEPQAAGSGAA